MKKYIEEKYVFSKDVDSNLHGEDVFFRFEDEDIKKRKKTSFRNKKFTCYS